MISKQVFEDGTETVMLLDRAQIDGLFNEKEELEKYLSSVTDKRKRLQEVTEMLFQSGCYAHKPIPQIVAMYDYLKNKYRGEEQVTIKIVPNDHRTSEYMNVEFTKTILLITIADDWYIAISADGYEVDDQDIKPNFKDCLFYGVCETIEDSGSGTYSTNCIDEIIKKQLEYDDDNYDEED